MNNILLNPLTIYIKRLLVALSLQTVNYKKHLSIGNMSVVKNCHFGTYNTIYENARLIDVTVGDFTYFSSNSWVSNAVIGKFCSIGPGVMCGLGIHPTSFVSTHPAFYSTQKQAQVTFATKNLFDEHKMTNIGNDVWIGARAIILDGVTIGDGAIIAAGAVVTKNVAPYAIMGGVPATIIKYRFGDDEIKSLLRLQWWNRDPQWLQLHSEQFTKVSEFLRSRSG